MNSITYKSTKLLKCKTIRNLFALNGCGISSTNKGDTIVFLLSLVPPQKRFHTPFTLKIIFSLHDTVQDCGISIVNALGILQCCTLSVTIGLVIPQCRDISLENQLRYCSAMCTSSSIFENRDQYNTDISIRSIEEWIWGHGQNRYRCCSIRKQFCRSMKDKERHGSVVSCIYSLAQ